MPVFQVDWQAVFVPTVALLELFVRGSAMYLGILVFMRVLPRQRGALSTADLLVLIIVADVAQNGMSAQYTSLTEGFVLVGTIFFWDYLLDKLAFHSPVFRKVLNDPPISLVKDGQLQRRNMRKEMLTKEDVIEQLREQGVDDIRQVRQCCLESDGNFSVIRMDGKEVTHRKDPAGVI
ncbi:MAG: DUF421 domain-containing protein [Phycisphaerae bacterium]|nr:DUF421 domain-containing protein [Gemmatimonadaceae bacterium]